MEKEEKDSLLDKLLFWSKFIGYRIGLIPQNIQPFIKRRLSFYLHYFRSNIQTDTKTLKETPNLLRVLQVTTSIEGGTRKHLISILKGLDRERFSQKLIFSTFYMDNNFQQEFPNLIMNELLIPLKIRKYPSFTDLINIFRIILIYRKFRFDIIHGHGAKGGAYARIISRIVGVKSVYTPHGGSLHPVYGSITQKIINGAEKVMFYLSDKLVFESSYSLKSYLKFVTKNYNEKMIVNYNGVRITERTLPGNIENSSNFMIGLFGHLRYLKGQDVLIDALPFLLTEFDGILVNIYGDGPDRKLLETKVKDLRLCNIIRFYGDVPDTEKYMKKCNLIVHPSRHEALGYTIIEAMSLGKPVVATKVGGIEEVVIDNETGILVPSDNPRLLAEAIARYIKDPVLGVKHGLAGRKRVETFFSEKQMIENLIRIYEDITNK